MFLRGSFNQQTCVAHFLRSGARGKSWSPGARQGQGSAQQRMPLAGGDEQGARRAAGRPVRAARQTGLSGTACTGKGAEGEQPRESPGK